MSVTIHPTAIVEDGARLGEDVSIGPGSIVGPHVTLGDSTRVDSHVLVTGWTRVGHDSHLHHGAVLGTAPQDLKYTGAESYLELGDHVEVRCCSSKEKCLHAAPGDVLIDDCAKYRNLWVEKGGVCITHRSAA